MRWSHLKLTTKFNLIISLLLFALFISAAIYNYRRQQELIVRGAIDNARIIAQQIIQTRDYMSSVIRNEPENNYNLVPQVVATQVARRITGRSPFYVRQISLRYRNPENRPDRYEAEKLLEYNRVNVGESWQVVTIDKNEELRYMLPMMAEKSCLDCHGTYESAPLFVKKRFPKGHYSYNYRVGEILGAVSVTIPMDQLYKEIGMNFRLDILYRGLMFVIVLLISGFLIHRIILHPVQRLANIFTEVTSTGSFSSRITRRTNDEIGQLINAFNAMMEELERKTLQRVESEERYRSFIEIAQSPVVTFLEDGKIVITNQRAEQMFGRSRSDLLGEDITSFFEDGDELRSGLDSYLRHGKGGGVGETTRRRLKTTVGTMEVDMSLSASSADKKTMFTAILRLRP